MNMVEMKVTPIFLAAICCLMQKATAGKKCRDFTFVPKYQHYLSDISVTCFLFIILFMQKNWIQFVFRAKMGKTHD